MKEFFGILKLVKGYGKYAVINVLFNLLAIIFSAFSLVMLMPIMEILFNQQDKITELLKTPPASNASWKDYIYYHLADLIHTYGPAQVLLYVCIAVVFFTLLKNLCTYFALYFIAIIRNGIVRDFRLKMYNRLVDLPLSYLSDEKKGNVISKMTK